MKHLEEKTVTTTAKQAYVKPTMEVHEMEVEGAILQSSVQEYPYGDPLSQADIIPNDPSINA